MGIWDKENHTFTDLNEIHNEEAMEGIFGGSSITALDLYQEPQATLKKKWKALMRHILRNLTHGHRIKTMKW